MTTPDIPDSPDWHRKMAEYAAAHGWLRGDTAGFFFVRHGETYYNDARIIQPVIGSRLNPAGKEQARKAGERLKAEAFDEFHASDQDRAFETATIIASFCGRPVHRNRDLRERDWGRWAGRSNVDLQWDGAPEKGETLEQFVVRSLRGLNAAISAGNVAVVAHGGTFAVLLAALGLPLRRAQKAGANRVVDNAAPMRIQPPNGSGGGWSVTVV